MLMGVIGARRRGGAGVIPSQSPQHSNTILLIEGLGAAGSNLAIDESARLRGAATTNGGAQVTNTSPTPAIGTGSFRFDGSGDWFEWADHADWTLGTNNFTIAMIFSLESAGLSTSQAFVSHYNATTSERGWILHYDGASKVLAFSVSADGLTPVSILSTVLNPTADTQYFVLVTRAGNKWRMHVGEVSTGAAPLVSSATNSMSIFDATVALMVGRAGNSGVGDPLYMNGTINTLVIAVGESWQADDDDAIIPTEPFDRGEFDDPDWPYVLLLTDATGKSNGAAIVDNGPFGRTLTAVGAAQILSQSLEFDGSEDWITAPDSGHWRFFNGVSNIDFTMEAFGVVFDALAVAGNGGAQPIFSQYDAFSPQTNQRAWTVSLSSGELLTLVISSSGSTAITPISTSWTPTLGQPYDIALVRSGADYSLYVDGTRIATATDSSVFFNSTSPLSIGARNSRASSGAETDDLDGRIKAVRITQKARYSGASYSVPSLPLPIT